MPEHRQLSKYSTKYTTKEVIAITDAICKRVGHGQSLENIFTPKRGGAAADTRPSITTAVGVLPLCSISTFLNWARKHGDIRLKLDGALAVSADRMVIWFASELGRANTSNDPKMMMAQAKMLQAVGLGVKTILSKLNPNRYADRPQITTNINVSTSQALTEAIQKQQATPNIEDADKSKVIDAEWKQTKP